VHQIQDLVLCPTWLIEQRGAGQGAWSSRRSEFLAARHKAQVSRDVWAEQPAIGAFRTGWPAAWSRP